MPESAIEYMASRLTGDGSPSPGSDAAFVAAAALVDAESRLRHARSDIDFWSAAVDRATSTHLLERLAARHRLALARASLDAADQTLRTAQASWEAVGRNTDSVFYDLMANRPFQRLFEELTRGNMLVVGVPGPIGSRRIMEFSYEAALTIGSMRSPRRLTQSLGWRHWPLTVPIGGDGGSQRLQIATPTGAEISRVTATPASAGSSVLPITVSVGTPRLTIQLPSAASQLRYQITIFVRPVRRGWLTGSLVAALSVAFSIDVGRLDLAVLYPAGIGQSAVLAAVLAAVLPAVLGGFGTLLAGSRQQTIVAGLLLPLRFLIALDFAVVLVAFGSFLLYSGRHPLPVALWSALAVIATAIAVLITVSWLLPARLPSCRDARAPR